MEMRGDQLLLPCGKTVKTMVARLPRICVFKMADDCSPSDGKKGIVHLLRFCILCREFLRLYNTYPLAENVITLYITREHGIFAFYL